MTCPHRERGSSGCRDSFALMLSKKPGKKVISSGTLLLKFQSLVRKLIIFVAENV
jgi:hypothetical protein